MNSLDLALHLIAAGLASVLPEASIVESGVDRSQLNVGPSLGCPADAESS
jgi:hypothetical protein